MAEASRDICAAGPRPGFGPVPLQAAADSADAAAAQVFGADSVKQAVQRVNPIAFRTRLWYYYIL